ncbi:MAG: pitrilysin family protein [Longimicrobiales bacterium]
MRVDIPFTRHRLDNGLTVLLHRDATLPVVSVNLWYHVGSKNERPGRTGFAHLFEHLMFEGSAHVPAGDFDDHLEAAGGVNNGSTTNDRTNYWENLPAGALELALWLEADRMGFLLDSMSQDKLDLQRDVVMNERRETVDNQPYGAAYETVYAHLYPPEHPYHWPVLGSMEDLEAATLPDVLDFFRTYYTPVNASLALAGDLDEAEALALVERHFGAIPPGRPVPPVVVPEVSLAEDVPVVVEDGVALPRLYVAWHSAPQFTDDDAALEVLSSVLTDGKSSRLYKRLVYDEEVAQDVGAFQNGQEVAGSFWLVATARPEVSLARIEAAVREEVARVAALGVEPVEVQRAVVGIETDFVRSLERVGGFDGKADRLNEYHVMTGDPGWAAQDLSRFQRVTPAAVQEAAVRFVAERPGVWLSVVPHGRTDLAASGDAPGTDPEE